MAKTRQLASKTKSKSPAKKFHFPLGRANFMILAFGVFTLVVGFILMAIPDHPDAFLTRTLAPVLLVFAFLVVIPIGLLYKEKKTDPASKINPGA